MVLQWLGSLPYNLQGEYDFSSEKLLDSIEDIEDELSMSTGNESSVRVFVTDESQFGLPDWAILKERIFH